MAMADRWRWFAGAEGRLLASWRADGRTLDRLYRRATDSRLASGCYAGAGRSFGVETPLVSHRSSDRAVHSDPSAA